MNDSSLYLKRAEHHIVLGNEFICVEINISRPRIASLKGDFYGNGCYGANVLTDDGGIVLQVTDEFGAAQSSDATETDVSCDILEQSEDAIVVAIKNIRVCTATSEVVSTWVVSLQRGCRNVTVETETVVISGTVWKNLLFSVFLRQWFLNALFKKGNVQFVQGNRLNFSSMDDLVAFYTMDKLNGSFAVIPEGNTRAVENNLITGTDKFQTGIEFVMSGSFPEKDIWSSSKWADAENVPVKVGQTFKLALQLFANNESFPVHNLQSEMNIESEDLRSFYTAIYGSAAGCLGNYQISGSAYPTLATPDRNYKQMHTFFDPDSWSTVTVLSYSGDAYLQNEARKVLELASRHMRKDGQIPHHFTAGEPTYVAISGTPQTGPNIFWIMAAVEYVTGTGNVTWLNNHYEDIKKAADWLMNFYDADRNLFKVNGPLWTDTFRRTGYTFDTNAMMVRLLDTLVSVSGYCGDKEEAVRYRQILNGLIQGLESLWNGEDHYITSRDAHWKTTKDMVDTENYMAVAFGIVSHIEQRDALMRRLDGGTLTHPGGRGTWVSERYYDREDCFLENTGDSACAMARHWWVDELAHYVVGDEHGFYTTYYNVRKDLLANTWMNERYNRNGEMIRAPYYHEYPEIINLLMREQVYGLQIKLDTVTINPFGKTCFVYHAGKLKVGFSKDLVTLSLPGHGNRIFHINGLYPECDYYHSVLGRMRSNHYGTLVFEAPIESECTISKFA